MQVTDTVEKILVAVDDSEHAKAALRWADAFVDRLQQGGHEPQATVLTASVYPMFDLPGDVDDAGIEQRGNAVLDEALSAVADGDRFERVVARGNASKAILDEAQQRGSDLIVVGSRGRSAIAQVLLGSVSRSVAARSTCPVAVIPRPADDATTADGPTVVGYDDSPGAKAAVRWAIGNCPGEIVVVSAWFLPSSAVYEPEMVDVDTFHQSVEQTLNAGLKEICGGEIDPRIRPVVQRDDPRLAILDPALDPSLIVIGARGHSGLSGVLLGSTVTYVAAHSSVPIVVVPPPDETAP